jgi:DNA polymerase-3 subunit epsilon
MSSVKLGVALPAEIAVFDTETDGVDVETAHIVTAFIGVMSTATGEITERWSWFLNTGHEIPKGASDVHGITTARMQLEGTDPAMGVFEIIQRLDILARRGLAIVAMNASFDITLLDREQARHWPATRPLFEGRWMARPDVDSPWTEVERGAAGAVYRTLSPVVFDPMVFDKAISKRRGKRKLVDLAEFYGVPVEANAHDAEADCRMVGRVAIKLLEHSRLADLTLSEVHALLIPTHRKNAHGLADYWADGKGGNPSWTREQRAEAVAEVRANAGLWPLRPRPITEQEGTDS